MYYLQTLLDGSDIPLITAFVLGLLTALSPCPLATNITAIGFISKDIDNRNKIFINGILYALGRVIAYTILGVILILIIKKGADTFDLQYTISLLGEKLFSPILIIIGIYMLLSDKISFSQFGLSIGSKTEKLKGAYGSLLLGILFALTFCPTSGVFYFGMLIPMSATHSEGYIYPVIFAIATALPVLIVSWVLAFSVQHIGRVYGKIKQIQKILNIIVGILFIIVGVYYGYMMYF